MTRDNDLTIAYYERNAAEYFQSTVNLDLSNIYQRFLRYIPAGGAILDAGSGSGRDTLAFLRRGFRVAAFDASAEMARRSTILTGVTTQTATWDELSAEDIYDGIWSCASLVHIPFDHMPEVLIRCRDALKSGGVLYGSFRHGSGDDTSADGRHFTDLTPELAGQLFAKVPGLSLLETWTNEDSNSVGRTTRWLNIIAQRDR